MNIQISQIFFQISLLNYLIDFYEVQQNHHVIEDGFDEIFFNPSSFSLIQNIRQIISYFKN